jgi:hypothetical protein
MALMVLAALAGPLVGIVFPASSSAQTPASLTISGTVRDQLVPGFMSLLDLSLDNSHPFALSVAGLVVTVDGVTAPNADPAHPCTTDDFIVRQLAAPSPFVVGGDTQNPLSSLGFADSQLPAVGMLDRPSNQDGCRGASVVLGYTATIESTRVEAAQPAVESEQSTVVPTPSAPASADPTTEATPTAASSASQRPLPQAAALPSPGASAGPPGARPSAAVRVAPPAGSIKPGTQVSGRLGGGGTHRTSLFKAIVDSIIEAVQTVAPSVIKGIRLPFGLLLAVLIFLLIQNWIDHRDPKLALAPSYADPDLSFDYRSPNPAKAQP